MKEPSPPEPDIMAPATLQELLDRVRDKPGLSDTRRRDLRSSIVIYGKSSTSHLSRSRSTSQQSGRL